MGDRCLLEESKRQTVVEVQVESQAAGQSRPPQARNRRDEAVVKASGVNPTPRPELQETSSLGGRPNSSIAPILNISEVERDAEVIMALTYYTGGLTALLGVVGLCQ
jgi:hypothetical protein